MVGLPYLVNAFLSVLPKTKLEVFPRIAASVLETPFVFDFSYWCGRSRHNNFIISPFHADTQIQTNRWRSTAPFEFMTFHSSMDTWLLTVTLRSAAPAAPCTYWRACANNSHTVGKDYHIHEVPAAHRCKLTNRRGGWTADAGPVGLEVLFRDAEEILFHVLV